SAVPGDPPPPRQRRKRPGMRGKSRAAIDQLRVPQFHASPHHESPPQSGAEVARTPDASRGGRPQPLRASVWSAVASAASAPLFGRRHRVVGSGGSKREIFFGEI